MNLKKLKIKDSVKLTKEEFTRVVEILKESNYTSSHHLTIPTDYSWGQDNALLALAIATEDDVTVYGTTVTCEDGVLAYDFNEFWDDDDGHLIMEMVDDFIEEQPDNVFGYDFKEIKELFKLYYDEGDIY